MTTVTLRDVSVNFADPVSDPAPLSRTASAVTSMFNRDAGIPTQPPPGNGEPPRAQALQAVNLEVREGETLGLLGPSGCGKTTMIRVIAGLTQPNSGHIYYDGRDMNEVPPHERGLGVVFQSYALYPQMTSAGNVGFFFRLRGREAEIPERIREVSKVMGIGFDKLLSKRPGILSGGERQRVAVARCIARDPKLLLFDEPLSNLDAKLRVQTRSELKRLIGRYRVTTVYVTHDQTEALALCDRIAIMNEGRIEQVGTAAFLLAHPNSTFVATFFGTPPMNLFSGQLREGYFDSKSFSLPIPSHTLGERPITIGVRAEDFQLQADGPIEGEIALVEPLLAERAQLVYFDHGDLRLVARLSETPHLRLGETIRLGVSMEHLHFFDPKTGRRL